MSDFSDELARFNKSKEQYSLIVKNFLIYEVSRNSNKKIKLKKVPNIKAKKFAVKDIELYSVDIMDGDELNAFIKAHPESKELYSSILDNAVNINYTLYLPITALRKLLAFLVDNNIKIGENFYFYRKGESFKTTYVFTVKSTNKVNKKAHPK